MSLAKARKEEAYLGLLDDIKVIHHEWADWLHERRSEFATYVFFRNNIKRWGEVTSNAAENANSFLLDVRSLPILYLINEIIQKTQATYVDGYCKAGKLFKENMVVTEHAFYFHRKLVRGAGVRKVFITQERDTWLCGKVSCGDQSSNFHCYIEVMVNAEALESHCPCMFYQKHGLCCDHIIALLKKKGKQPREKWWFAQRYHTRTYHSSYSGVVPTIAFEKLEADLFFAPPDYKKPAGRPPRARKDRSHLNKTQSQHQCSSCGGLGHSFRTCTRPSTQFRFEHHYDKAVAWTKAFNYYDKSEEV